MKLYTFDPAPNPNRLRLFIAYKGINITTEQIDMMAGQHLKSEFAAINPSQTLPTLVLDDGQVMTETIGICHYLESLYPEKPLMGQTDLEKAEVISWDHKLFMTGFMAIAEIFRNSNPAFEGRALPGPVHVPQIPDLITRGQLRLEAFFPEIDAHLATGNYIVGNSITLADIDLYATIIFAGWIKTSIPESCSHLLAWFERVKEELGE